MTLVVTGPEGSGTTILAHICAAAFPVEVRHRSMPHAEDWWTPERDPDTGEAYPPDTRWLIIQRRPDVTTLAILGRKPPLATDIHNARYRWRRAMVALAALPDAYWLTYEALIVDPARQIANVGTWLGMTPAPDLPVVRDENAKWLSALE